MQKLLFFLLLPFLSFSQNSKGQLICIPPKDFSKVIREAITAYNLQNPNQIFSTNPVLFDWPVQQATGFNDPSVWGISAYFDHNPSYGQTQDYNCGTHTYDVSGYNHSGTDIYAAPFGWKMMDAGQVDVIAAADGVIIYKEGSNFDRNCDFSNPNWNVVVLQHSDGTTTTYGHLKTNSLTTKSIGSTVLKGEFLGKVGSSGSSNGPHLHFECNDSNGDPFDPFTGTCNTGGSRWLAQKPYLPTGILKVTTNSAQAVYPTCPNPEVENEKTSFQVGETVLSFGYVRAMKTGQAYSLKFKNPSGVVVENWAGTQNIDEPYDYFISGIYVLPSNAPLGTWQIEFTYNGETVTKNFTVTCSPPSIPTAISASRCGSGTVILSASNCSGSIQWFNSTTGGTAFHTGSYYTTLSLSTSTTYYVNCSVGTCVSTSRSAVTVTINAIPATPTISNSTINSGQTATLTASGCSGTINWYSAASGESSLGTGNSFTTPSINTTTIYYASCAENNCVSNSRGSGTVTVNACTAPTATLSGTQTIISGQIANLTISFTGLPPYSFTINDAITYENISSNPFIIGAVPEMTTLYSLTGVSNACGQGSVSGNATVTVNPPICDPFEPNNQNISSYLLPSAPYTSPDLCFELATDQDWFKLIAFEKIYFLKIVLENNSTLGKYKIVLTYFGNYLEIKTINGSNSNIDTYLQLFDATGTTSLAFSQGVGHGSIYIENKNIPCFESLDFHKNLYPDIYKTSKEIVITTSSLAIQTTLNAGTSITLNPGFESSGHKVFTAKIEGCNSNIVPNSNLVAKYNLKYNQGVIDDTRFQNNGNMYGTTNLMLSRSNTYYCHDFNGVTNNAYMVVPNQSQLALGTNFTYSVWYNLKSYFGMDGFRQNVANGTHALLAKEGDRAGFYLAISNDTQNDRQRITYANVDANGTQNFFLIGKPAGLAADNLNIWNHLLITFSSNTMKMYINGTKVSETAGIVPNFAAANTKNLNIGRMFALNNSWYPFNGAADDLKIFNRTLSDTEVLNLYNYEK